MIDTPLEHYMRQGSFKKDMKVFHSWAARRSYWDSNICKADQADEKRQDDEIEKQMTAVVTALTDAKRASLRAFCKTELIALQNAYDACVERMKQWEGDDIDVEKICAESALFKPAPEAPAE